MKLEFADKRVNLGGSYLELPLPVLDAIRMGDRIMVIHDYKAYPPKAPTHNLVAYAVSGERLWVAENLTENHPTDAYVNFCSEEPLWAGNFSGFDCKIDPQTGKVLETLFTK